MIFLQFIISTIGVTCYSSRIAGIETKKLSTSFSIYNILTLGSRLANMILLPLLGAIVEIAIVNNDSILLAKQFYFILGGILLGTFVGLLFIPFSTKIFKEIVEKASKYSNIFSLLIKECNIKNIKRLLKHCSIISIKEIKEMKFKNFPMFPLILNPLIVAINTISYLSAMYAGVLVPESRLVASQLSSTVNGISTILLYIFVDPAVGIISDQAINDRRSLSSVKAFIFYLGLGRLIGVIISFLLFIPAAYFIADITKFIA